MPISQDQFDDIAKKFEGQIPALGNDPHAIRKRVEALEMVLERSMRIPGVNIPVGLDSIVGLIPVVRDIITAVMGAYLVW